MSADYRELIANHFAGRLMILRRGNPDMGGPNPQDRHWGIDLAAEAMIVRVPDLCPDCIKGVRVPDLTTCTHPNAPTIGDLLRWGTNAATADVEGMCELMHDLYEEAATDDVNPDFDTFDDQWEPWMSDDEPDFTDTIGGCDYCGAPDVRDVPDPFGGKPCCDGCFNMIIGDDRDAPPWRCGNAKEAQP